MLNFFKKRKVSLYHQCSEKKCSKTWFFKKKNFWWKKMKILKKILNDHFAFIWLPAMLKACLSGLYAFLRRFLAPFRPLKNFGRFHRISMKWHGYFFKNPLSPKKKLTYRRRTLLKSLLCKKTIKAILLNHLHFPRLKML